MAFNSEASSASAEINVTPLIDVLLVLLIIFMVIVPVAPAGLSTLLPQPAKSQPPAAVEPPIVVRVQAGADGQPAYTLNRQPVLKASLAPELRRMLSERADKVVFVGGDRTLQFSTVAEVIGMGREAHAERIGVLTPATQAGD